MLSPTHLRALALCSAVAALGLAACGGGSSEQLDSAQLISRADELCRGGQEKFAEIQKDPPANSKDAVEQTDLLVDAAAEELEELRSLRPPEELRGPYDSYLTARGGALELMEEGRDAAAGRDAQGYAEAQAKVSADSGKRQKLAAAVGLTVCSAPPK